MEKHKSKCFSGLSKQIFGVLLYAIKNSAIKNMCKRNSPRAPQLLDAANCINKNDPIITKCYTNMIDGMMGAKNANDTLKIPYMCW